MYVLCVYHREHLPLAREISPESTEWPYICFGHCLLNSISYHFLLYRFTPPRSCCVLNRISDRIDEVLSLYSSANIVVFGEFNAHHASLPIHCNITDLAGIQAMNFSIMQCLSNGFPPVILTDTLLYVISSLIPS